MPSPSDSTPNVRINQGSLNLWSEETTEKEPNGVYEFLNWSSRTCLPDLWITPSLHVHTWQEPGMNSWLLLSIGLTTGWLSTEMAMPVFFPLHLINSFPSGQGMGVVPSSFLTEVFTFPEDNQWFLSNLPAIWLNMTWYTNQKDKVAVIRQLWLGSLNLLNFSSPKGQII